MPRRIPPPWIENQSRRRPNFSRDVDPPSKPRATGRARKLSPDECAAIERQLRAEGKIT